MNESKKFRLNLRDILRGLVVAVLTPVAFIAQQSIEAGSLHIDPKTAAMAGVGGGIAYLVKNLLTGKKEDEK